MRPMLKTTIILAASLAAGLAAAPASAQSVGEKTGVNALLGVTPSTADFVREAAASDMFEIQSSGLAATKGDEGVKSFADHMTRDHTKTTQELKALVSSGKAKVELPTEMSSSQKSMIEKLRGLDGADFAKQYASDQVSAHKDAVSLFERYAKGGDNADLKAWADKTLPALREHLRMAQELNGRA